MITNKIKEYRKNKNMTQEELANELGVSRKTLSSIESGSVIPKVDIAYNLSLIFEVTVEELFYNKKYDDLRIKKQEGKFNNIANLYFKIENKK